MVFFITYIITAEYAKPPKSEGEVLVFRRGKVPPAMDQKALTDEEVQSRNMTSTEKVSAMPTDETSEKRPRPSECGKPIFHWEDICYDVKIKDQDRRILDFVDGWVQPGVITALMVIMHSRLLCALTFFNLNRAPLVLVKQHYSTLSLLGSPWA